MDSIVWYYFLIKILISIRKASPEGHGVQYEIENVTIQQNPVPKKHRIFCINVTSSQKNALSCGMIKPQSRKRWHSSASAFTVWCWPLCCWVWSLWYSTSPGHGVRFAPWEPWRRVFANWKTKETLNKSSAAERRIFCPQTAVWKMGNTYSIPSFSKPCLEPKSFAVSSCRFNQSFPKNN